LEYCFSVHHNPVRRTEAYRKRKIKQRKSSHNYALIPVHLVLTHIFTKDTEEEEQQTGNTRASGIEQLTRYWLQRIELKALAFCDLKHLFPFLSKLFLLVIFKSTIVSTMIATKAFDVATFCFRCQGCFIIYQFCSSAVSTK
jgi:hypothetical protein